MRNLSTIMLSVVASSMLGLACGHPTDDDGIEIGPSAAVEHRSSDEAPARRTELPDPRAWIEERHRKAEEAEAKLAPERELAEAASAVDSARDEVRRVGERLQEMRNDLGVEQQMAREARAAGDLIAADNHDEHAKEISAGINQLEDELVDLKKRVADARDEYLRVKRQNERR